MNLSISSAFDGGNIRLVGIDGNRVDLEIEKDHQSDFYQWFYFRLTGAKDQAVQLRLAEMAMKVDAARLLIHRAVWSASEGLPSIRESSIAKCFANEMAKKVSDLVRHAVCGGITAWRPRPARQRDSSSGSSSRVSRT